MRQEIEIFPGRWNSRWKVPEAQPGWRILKALKQTYMKDKVAIGILISVINGSKGELLEAFKARA